ncbi:hypothetical protein BDV93DRAFT_515897 [Ceratobasidium sp. AG-I]|nr:hypothetical protein BDV93DRAFT_515897 [Ceratobasidium sp. AG-I]
MNLLFERSYGAVAAKVVQAFLVEFHLPPFGATSNNEKTWKPCLGSNFTLSHSNFSNKPHLDGDGFCYVLSIYMFVDCATGELIIDPAKISVNQWLFNSVKQYHKKLES